MIDHPLTLNDPNAYFKQLEEASASHWWARGVERIERNWVQNGLKTIYNQPPSGLSWLDIGSGTGARLKLWSKWNCWSSLVGVEPERAALAALTDVPFHQILCGWPGLPFEPTPMFHLVTAFDVIQHVEPPRRENAIHEAAALLLPGGLCLIRTNGSCFQRRDDSIVQPRDLRRWLADAGLRVPRESYYNLAGGLLDELRGWCSLKKNPSGDTSGALKTGLPGQWRARPGGHWAAGLVGGLESRISAFGLAKIPFGHSYIVLATKDDPHHGRDG